jgi:hypothetical protein
VTQSRSRIGTDPLGCTRVGQCCLQFVDALVSGLDALALDLQQPFGAIRTVLLAFELTGQEGERRRARIPFIVPRPVPVRVPLRRLFKRFFGH